MDRTSPVLIIKTKKSSCGNFFCLRDGPKTKDENNYQVVELSS